jgi:hypothetical protein
VPFVATVPDAGFASGTRVHTVVNQAQEKTRAQKAPQSACAECLRQRAATRAAFVNNKGS